MLPKDIQLKNQSFQLKNAFVIISRGEMGSTVTPFRSFAFLVLAVGKPIAAREKQTQKEKERSALGALLPSADPHSFLRFSQSPTTTAMGDEEAPQCKVEYLDVPDGGEEVTNWIKRAGKCRVTYPNNEIFEGSYAQLCAG